MDWTPIILDIADRLGMKHPAIEGETPGTDEWGDPIEDVYFSYQGQLLNRDNFLYMASTGLLEQITEEIQLGLKLAKDDKRERELEYWLERGI